MTEASTHLLDYNDKKLRGMSSRQYRTKSPAVNGNSFTSGGSVIQFEIQGNQLNHFCDFQNSYVLMEVENKAGADFFLDKNNGIQNLIQKIECVTAGQTLFSCDRYNVLSSMLMSSDTNSLFESNVGNILLGSGAGNSLIDNAKQTFAVPIMLNGLYNSSKYIPLFSRDKITIRITLESAVTAFNGVAIPLATSVKVNNPELVLHNVELSADAFGMVYDAVDGVFDIVSEDYRHTQAVIPVNSTSSISNLGFAFSSLNRVLACMRNSTNITLQDKISISSRSKAGLTKANVLYNGEKIPQREILSSATNSAECLAELLVAQGGLGSMTHSSKINSGSGYGDDAPSGDDNDNAGTFFLEVGLESMRSDTDGLYSGANTIGGVLQLELGVNNAGVPLTLDVFGNYTSQYSLDMKGTQIFSVSV